MHVINVSNALKTWHYSFTMYVYLQKVCAVFALVWTRINSFFFTRFCLEETAYIFFHITSSFTNEHTSEWEKGTWNARRSVSASVGPFKRNSVVDVQQKSTVPASCAWSKRQALCCYTRSEETKTWCALPVIEQITVTVFVIRRRSAVTKTITNPCFPENWL